MLFTGWRTFENPNFASRVQNDPPFHRNVLKMFTLGNLLDFEILSELVHEVEQIGTLEIKSDLDMILHVRDLGIE